MSLALVFRFIARDVYNYEKPIEKKMRIFIVSILQIHQLNFARTSKLDWSPI